MKQIPNVIQPKTVFYLICLVILSGSLLGMMDDGQNDAPASSRLELLHADYSRGTMQNGRPLKILEGNVYARQDTLQLWCQRAVYNEQEKNIMLTGRVKLVRGSDTLTAIQVTYYEETKLAVAVGNVEVRRPGRFLQTDHLEYYYGSDKIRARGHLKLDDQENFVHITAGAGEYLPDEKRTYVEDHAHLWQIDSTATDTLNIFSRRMDYFFGEERLAIAIDSVRIIQGLLHARCDSAVYDLDTEIAYLEKEPYAVQENNEMFGKQMALILKDMELEQIRISGGARAVSVVDSAREKENRLEGREIIMYISNRKLRELKAISNARSTYYLKEKKEDKGVNVASADTIKAFFEKNELDSIAVIGGSQGTFYPEDYKGPIAQE